MPLTALPWFPARSPVAYAGHGVISTAIRVSAGSPKRGSARYPTIGYVATRGCSTLATVQRLFSMFPPGLPGLALLLLRTSVASSLLLESYVHRGAIEGWVEGVAIL